MDVYFCPENHHRAQICQSKFRGGKTRISQKELSLVGAFARDNAPYLRYYSPTNGTRPEGSGLSESLIRIFARDTTRMTDRSARGITFN